MSAIPPAYDPRQPGDAASSQQLIGRSPASAWVVEVARLPASTDVVEPEEGPGRFAATGSSRPPSAPRKPSVKIPQITRMFVKPCW